MDNQLEKLHAVEVEILDYVVDICNKNNLTYMLIYGTALGAYRHQGFIPWDDDLDIAMPREDYNKFLEIMENEKNSKYDVRNEKNEKKWFLIFSKVRKNETIFLESIAEGIYEHNGIYIDIFPLDSVDDTNQTSLWFRRKKIDYYRHALKFVSCKNLYKEKYSKKRYSIEQIISLPAKIMGVRKSLQRLNKLIVKGGNGNSLGLFDNEMKSNSQILPYDVYLPVSKLSFEGKEYNAPHKICDYLTAEYGETYMQLPPENERTTHMPKYIKF